MDSVKYIGMDVHKKAIAVAILNSTGKLVMECVIETKAVTILDFLKGSREEAGLDPRAEPQSQSQSQKLDGAATVASAKAGPFKDFYDALVAKGIRPEIARLTLAHKIAAITLIVWKKGVRFDAQHLKPQTA
jgi:hypothetical protein